MESKDKISRLKSFKKETDIHDLLDELLPKMGYNDVTITHERGNAPEYGKDVIASIYNEIDDVKEWTAFVVKKGDVAGSTGVVKEIEGQIDECFEYSYKSPTVGANIRINNVKVVINGKYKDAAKTKILTKGDAINANVKFWDVDTLIKHIDRSHHHYWIEGSKSYRQYAELVLGKASLDKNLRTFGINEEKIKKIIECFIKPKLSEYITDDDGNLTTKSRECHSIVNIPENAIIVGDAGSGKSTLIDTLVSDVLLQNSYRNDTEYFPINLKFTRLLDAEFDLAEAIKNWFNEPEIKAFGIDIDSVIKENRCVLFIDALDEIAENSLKEKCLASILRFRDDYPNIKVYCTSRSSDYLLDKSRELGFTYLKINAPSNQQIDQYLSSYFSTDMVKCDRLRKSLQDSEILNKMPKTPLTLSLITVIFDETGMEIPATISDLYDQFTDVMLGVYNLDNTTQLLDAGVKRRLLSHIAHYYHKKNIQSLEEALLIKEINTFSTERGHDYSAELVLNEIMGKTGMLFKNDKQEIQFKHLSFQEYFTAFEYYNFRPQETGDFTKKFNNLWWQSVAIFYAGMSKDAPKLIKTILDESRPSNFLESINNTGGIGRLLQALYNSDIKERTKGVERGMENMIFGTEFLMETDDPKYNFWKNLSKYGIIQSFAAWFQMNNWSITMLNPLQNRFEELVVIHDSGKIDEQNLYELEYQMHTISILLASPTFGIYAPYTKFLQVRKSKRLELEALIDFNFQLLERDTSKDIRNSDEFKIIHRKIHKLRKRISTIKGIEKLVNIPVKKLVEKANKELK
jgi:GTPase SAR1 family protein